MTSGSKTISNSLRPKIDTMKSLIRWSVRPFDGSGYVFKEAVSELRKEGLNIQYIKDKCHYVILT